MTRKHNHLVLAVLLSSTLLVAIARAQTTEQLKSASDASVDLARLYGAAGRFEDAQRMLEAALKQSPSPEDQRVLAIALADVHFSWAESLQKKYAYADAIQHYQAAFEIDKRYRRGQAAIDLNNSGLAYQSLSEYDRAISYYEQALAIWRDGKEAGALQGRADLTPREAAWAQRYREIADRVTAIGAQRGALLAKRSRTPADEQQLAQLEADLAVAQKAFQRFLADLTREFGSSQQVKDKILPLQETQGLMEELRELGPGTVALYTLVGEEKYRILLITPEVRVAREYPISAADLSRKVLDFRQMLQAVAFNKKTPPDPRPLAHEL